MRVVMESAGGHAGRANEDFTGAVPGVVVLVDGAGIPGAGVLCRHGVGWYASRLAGTLLGIVPLAPDRALADLLGDAIERVTADHGDTCDVADPSSPSAAVAILRISEKSVEYLVRDGRETDDATISYVTGLRREE